jgi:hypothetical protein
LDGTGKINRIYYDIGLIYNSRRLRELHSAKIYDVEFNKTWKIAYRIDFEIIESKEPLFLFISHWPSRIYAKYEAIRETLAERLRRNVSEIINSGRISPSIILMGDYNDEPFHRSINEKLMSSRDRNRVIKNKDLLYNPFWRLLGESKPFVGENEDNVFAGTCYCPSENRIA